MLAKSFAIRTEDNVLSIGLRSGGVSQLENPFIKSGLSHKNNDLLRNPASSSPATSRSSLARRLLLLQLSATSNPSFTAKPAAKVEQSAVDSLVCHNVRIRTVSRSKDTNR